MKFVDEFRDPQMARRVLERIHAVVEEIPTTAQRPLQIMEVCGGHTHSIFRYGLEELLPDKIKWCTVQAARFVYCRWEE